MKAFPDWVVKGAKVAVVRTNYGRPQSYTTGVIEKINKASFRVSGVTDLFKLQDVTSDGEIRHRSPGDWSTGATRVWPDGHPDANKAYLAVSLEHTKYEVSAAAERFQREPSVGTATELARLAGLYATLTSADPDDLPALRALMAQVRRPSDNG